MGNLSRNQIGIVMICLGTGLITLNDMAFKALSGEYPLYQIVFARSLGGLFFALFILRIEGGWQLLKTTMPWQHAARALMLVTANVSFFLAIAAMPLALVSALFFVAPLLITLLSIPVLGERVGVHRWTAVGVGFAGVVVMLIPEMLGAGLGVPWWSYGLPLVSALGYAGNQVMTRKLGMKSRASALVIYSQAMFLIVSLCFYVAFGQGQFADQFTNESLLFLFRAWVWPAPEDMWIFTALGLNVAVVAYFLSQSYRLAEAGVIAPFEYIALPLAVFWGWSVFGEVPRPFTWVGIALIAGAGLYVVWRERISAKRD
jgi:S-adenosylmethionine uptake transporter